ncbi:MAG: ABC transporter permease [Coriobacteriia bacterium]|nr:ABC transporter permease [Coriobacteriia bacterium]
MINKINIRQLLPIIGLVAITILFNILTQGRLLQYWGLTLSQVHILILSSMGVFFIMTMGSLDFSQGSILGISSIVISVLSPISIPLAIVAGVVAGALIGAINGYFSVFRRLQSFIVTICTMFLFRGVIKLFTSKAPIPCTLDMINLDSYALRITVLLIVCVIFFIIFSKTKFGVQLKAIGSGEKAARFSGVKIEKVKFFVFVLAGALTGLAAFFNVIKVGSVTSSAGNQLETQILIALVLGGMPISGGAKVRFQNIIVGSFLFVILNSGLSMMGISTQVLQLIEGAIFLIFVAVFADRKFLHIIK